MERGFFIHIQNLELMFQKTHRGEAEGRLLVSGCSPLEAVQIQIVPSSLSLTPEQKSEVAPAVERLRNRGHTVTNGPIYRVESFTAGEYLHLELSERRYFDSVLLKQIPQWGLRSQVLALVAVTECADGYLIERRSEKVASLAGYWHPAPSGSVEPPAHPLQTFYTEAEEELGILPVELTQVECLGLVFGEQSGVFQLLARATTELSLSEILSRECSGAWERSELHCVPADEQELREWLQTADENLTRGGRVALLSEGARRWGESFLEGQLD